MTQKCFIERGLDRQAYYCIFQPRPTGAKLMKATEPETSLSVDYILYRFGSNIFYSLTKRVGCSLERDKSPLLKI